MKSIIELDTNNVVANLNTNLGIWFVNLNPDLRSQASEYANKTTNIIIIITVILLYFQIPFITSLN